MKTIKAIHNCPKYQPLNGKYVKVIEPRKVNVLAIAGIYAMVRRPGCYPYIADSRDVEIIKPLSA